MRPRSSLRNAHQFDLVTDLNAVVGARWDYRLERRPRGGDRARPHLANNKTPALIEPQRVDVVVRGYQPRRSRPHHLVKGREEGGADARPLRDGFEVGNLVIVDVAVASIGQETNGRVMGVEGDQTGQVEHVEQLAAPGLHTTAHLRANECLSPSQITRVERAHVHGHHYGDMANEPTPDLVVTLAPVLAATDPSDHPLLIAMLERWAAERYREWADAVGDFQTTALLACAEREEEIASRVEALYSDSAEVQQRLEAANPLLRGALSGSFTWRPIDEQWAEQAQAERLGAATWRSFARRAAKEDDLAAAEVFEICALMEETSAEVLENFLSQP